QLEALEPLVATADKYDQALERRAELERRRDAVRLFFTERRIGLLGDEIEQNQQASARVTAEKESAERRRSQLAQARDELIAERAAAGATGSASWSGGRLRHSPSPN